MRVCVIKAEIKVCVSVCVSVCVFPPSAADPLLCLYTPLFTVLIDLHKSVCDYFPRSPSLSLHLLPSFPLLSLSLTLFLSLRLNEGS